MKMILQKHTSKFVAGLFNSLGITACVALTSCGGENKVKPTENQGENLKNDLKYNDLKNVVFYKNLADDEDSLKAIADWLNSNGKNSTYILTAKDLKEIFQNDTKLNEVAEKLGVKLTESEPNPDDKKKKEIQKWVTKLNGLNVDGFNKLDDGLKEKVAQKFIDNKIDIESDEGIKEKLDGFIYEVEDEKKQNEISIKVGGGGKVTITNVFDEKTTDFDFDSFEELRGFVDALDGKYITNEEVKLSFDFVDKSVKICGHQTGFEVTDCFEKFLNCFGVLARIKNLSLDVSGLSLKVEGVNLKLNEIICSDGYFKETKFWTLVKDYASFFGITEGEKFEIEKKGGEKSATVKIGEFETTLKWSDVVKTEDEGFVDNSGWNKIFKLKSDEEPKEVTVEFENGKCTCSEIKGYKSGVDLNSLEALKNLVGALGGKNVKIGEGKNFSLAFGDKNVFVCGDTSGFEVMVDDNFKTLLQYVVELKDLKAVKGEFQIEIAVDTNDIKLGGKKIDQGFMVTENFWGVVKEHVKLFGDLGSKKIAVAKVSNTKRVKIGESELGFDVLNDNDGVLDDGWNEIFNIEG